MWTLLWQLAFETGMRQAERFGLTPSELVTRDGIHGIEIRHQLQYLKKDTIIPNWLHTAHIQGNYYLLPPKTKQGKRFIPISTQLAQIGASEDARTSMMGHAKITTTAGYTHWNPTTLATLANQARQAINQ
ncbi:hypothetical protein CYJ32_02225 [Alloscardovia omnicolens]|uniref:Tyr recombinase domain-containing protein n=3 Tax=Alloscardovia omnicolens TaxID=419015 RepID=U1SCA5_9BIFI|nr:hypothetical protein HMPREF9244_01616 [Alloscardovia omnicolens F0580]MDU6641226.1 hypothetical protein [Alloscardovia omnicolens]PKZ16262.1 hypothetical protein CYJ32_02225 [Alloscardovia omnicolens]